MKTQRQTDLNDLKKILKLSKKIRNDCGDKTKVKEHNKLLQKTVRDFRARIKARVGVIKPRLHKSFASGKPFNQEGKFCFLSSCMPNPSQITSYP